jgi:hypothetical protein
VLVLPLLIRLPVVFSGVVDGVVSQVNGVVIAQVTVTPANVLNTNPYCDKRVAGTVMVQLAVNSMVFLFQTGFTVVFAKTSI